jgi:hypothetical protein
MTVTMMTRQQAIQKCKDIIDELVETEIAARNYDADTENFVLYQMERWKASKMAEVEQWVDAIAKRMLN